MVCRSWLVGVTLATVGVTTTACQAQRPAGPAPRPLVPIMTTCVDAHATGYATFQSHNQKVVSNRNGIFMTYIKTRNDEFSAQQWRLLHSPDGGRSFQTLYQETNATNPPALETDEEANLYLVRPDFRDGQAYLYRFLAGNQYAHPLITQIPGGGFDKYCLVYDRGRQLLHFLIKTGRLYALGLDGAVHSSGEIVAPGPHASMEYPHLALDRDGTLYAAWTTQQHGQYLYWDIHTMRSQDGGRNWTQLDGASLPLPVVGDDTGPAERVTLDDEFTVHTWLSNFMAKDGKLHFVYQAQTQPGREHYVRYDLKTARKDRDLWPEFRGDQLSLQGLDGFFASRASLPNALLYCMLNDQGRLACLASDDHGETWYDYAVSTGTFTLYALGGCRELTADGEIIGSFTDQTGGTSRVFFFKIPGGAQRPE